MSRELIVLPDDTALPLLTAVNDAARSVRVKMFVMTDPDLIAALIAARGRGVDVKVMLNAARRSGESENDETRKQLVDGGVDVNDSNPAFDLTHEKSMVVDDETAYVMSLNWETRNVTETRDYGVSTKHKHEVAEVAECFDADWNRTEFDAGQSKHLIWCNNNGRERFAHFIDSAKETLWLQNERYQDAVIIERVVRAVTRGVKVRILSKAPHSLKKDKLIEGVGGLRIMNDVGAKVHKLKGLKLHAKMMLVDDARAIIGSVNLAPGSFDGRRELAIEVDDDHVVKRLKKVAEHDWDHSVALDLSDEGLLADLEKRGNEKVGASDLVLDEHEEEHQRKHKHKH